LAAASIDDTISIAVYGIISNIMFTKSSLLTTTLGVNNFNTNENESIIILHSLLLQVPITIIGGVAFGIIWGYLLAYVPSKHDKFVMPIRIVLLFLGAYFSVFASNFIGYAGAGMNI
jgi:NhaP-type Na+/H+ or K+/H+ antiporter